VSFNTGLENRTPFEATTFVFPDADGQEVLLVVMAATFAAIDSVDLQLSDTPSPIRSSDQYRGDPASSSTAFEADLALMKPFVDVLVNGHAYAPRGVETSQVQVRVAVGDIDKTLMVTGDRNPSGSTLTFRTMPLIFERAFGGTDAKGRVERRNPVGVGFNGALSADPSIQTVAPNIEYPKPAERTLPGGFGPVGRGWQPRIDFAGTYDEAWLDNQWPLLPTDFDPRHYQAAPIDQQSRTIRGGETVHVVNMTPSGLWRFKLPTLDVAVWLLYEGQQQVAKLSMDTVLLEPDNYRVTLTSRLSVRTVRNSMPLREVVLGHVTRGWLRARAARKVYIDYSGADGTERGRALFKS
jgi:hypothetical protein